MWNKLSRRPAAACDPSVESFERLEPRIVLDGTPVDPAHPVVEIETSYGNIYIELFSDTAPATVENFLGYVNRGDYDGTFFHRLVKDFVLQGGGYAWDEDGQTLVNVVQQDPVQNEFGPSNLEWTVAMAKLGGDPDSATSQWFINLGDNSENLDNQNGGFTVFGEVVGGRDTVAEIAGLQIANLGGNFTTLPVTDSFDPDRSEIFNSDLVVLHDVELVYDPDLSLVAGGSGVTGGSANFANRTTVTLPNDLGRPLAFQQHGAGSGWTVVDLNLKTERSGDASSPVTWVDPKDTRTYAAAVSEDGLIIYKNLAPGLWTSRNLNDVLPGAGLITSTLTVFVANGGRVYIAGLNGSGEMLLFNQTGGASGGEYTWVSRNLSTTDLVAAGDETPAFTSNLASYVTSWNGLNIVGLDGNGDVQALWWAPGQPVWQASNLSAITGAPTMQGSVAPYLTSWGAINLAGTDESGNVVVTWWVPNGSWNTSNLTSLFSGPELDAGSVATYVTPWGGTNVLGRNADGEVVVYWWSPTSGGWKITVLSQFIEGAEVPTGSIVGFSSASGTVNLFGTADDGDLIRYWWKPNDVWRWENVTATADLV